jgi:galactokinase
MALIDAGLEPAPIEGVISSTLPSSSGLSSSAALELCLLSAWNALQGFGLSSAQLADLAWRAETDYVGVQCGVMDQIAVAHGMAGHSMFLDTRSKEVEQIRMPDDLEIAVLDTRTPRSLASAAYNDRVAECRRALEHVRLRKPQADALRDAELEDIEGLSGPPFRRARHVITENARVIAFRQALLTNNRAELGLLAEGSQASLRDDYEVSSPALDAMVDAARPARGCVAVRLTGAGFGGCCVALVEGGRLEAFRADVLASYQGTGHSEPIVFATRPCQGASFMNL